MKNNLKEFLKKALLGDRESYQEFLKLKEAPQNEYSDESFLDYVCETCTTKEFIASNVNEQLYVDFGFIITSVQKQKYLFENKERLIELAQTLLKATPDITQLDSNAHQAVNQTISMASLVCKLQALFNQKNPDDQRIFYTLEQRQDLINYVEKIKDLDITSKKLRYLCLGSIYWLKKIEEMLLDSWEATIQGDNYSIFLADTRSLSKWFIDAANEGDAYAQIHLYLIRKLVVGYQDPETINWLYKAALQNNSDAVFYLRKLANSPSKQKTLLSRYYFGSLLAHCYLNNHPIFVSIEEEIFSGKSPRIDNVLLAAGNFLFEALIDLIGALNEFFISKVEKTLYTQLRNQCIEFLDKLKPHIDQVEIRDNENLHGAGLKEVMKYLEPAKVQKVVMNKNKLDDEDYTVLRNLTGLYELDLTSNKITQESSIAKDLKVLHTNLTSLSLVDNPITNESSKHIEEAVTNNTTLTNLELSFFEEITPSPARQQINKNALNRLAALTTLIKILYAWAGNRQRICVLAQQDPSPLALLPRELCSYIISFTGSFFATKSDRLQNKWLNANNFFNTKYTAIKENLSSEQNDISPQSSQKR